MKTRVLLLILALSGIAHAQTAATAPGALSTAPFFSDVPRDHWAFAAVQRLASAGIIEGVGAAGLGTAGVSAALPKAATAPAPRVAGSGVATTDFAARTKTVLGANPALKGALINVDVLSQKNQLVLRGTVKSEAQKHLATALAHKSAPGTAVSNLLRVVR